MSLNGVTLSTTTNFGLVFAASLGALASGDVIVANASPFRPASPVAVAATAPIASQHATAVLEYLARRDLATRDVVAK